jgi:hyperosmotically inducible periplasmic protein
MKRSPLLQLALTGLIVCIALTLGACSSTRTTGEQIDDAMITTKVKAKLAADPEVNPFNIDVDSNDGVVTLQGTVRDSEARTIAERLARETEGVRRVLNLIKVEPGR